MSFLKAHSFWFCGRIRCQSNFSKVNNPKFNRLSHSDPPPLTPSQLIEVSPGWLLLSSESIFPTSRGMATGDSIISWVTPVMRMVMCILLNNCSYMTPTYRSGREAEHDFSHPWERIVVLIQGEPHRGQPVWSCNAERAISIHMSWAPWCKGGNNTAFVPWWPESG